jgi:hypothetical protein
VVTSTTIWEMFAMIVVPSRGAIDRIAGPLAEPGLLMMPVCWTRRSTPSRVHVAVVVTRL